MEPGGKLGEVKKVFKNIWLKANIIFQPDVCFHRKGKPQHPYCQYCLDLCSGESHHKPSSVHEDADEYVEIESEGTADNSQTERAGSTSSSETDTANTPKTVVAASDRNLNDAMLNNSSVLSSDTSVSSLSDNTSFHESSIAFSSTCIKTSASDTISPPEFTADSTTEGANESAGV